MPEKLNASETELTSASMHEHTVPIGPLDTAAPMAAWHDLDLDISLGSIAEQASDTHPYGGIRYPKPLLIGAPGRYQESIQNVVVRPTSSCSFPVTPSPIIPNSSKTRWPDDLPRSSDEDSKPLEAQFVEKTRTLLAKNNWDEGLFQELRDEAIASGLYRSLERLRGIVLRGTNEVIRNSCYVRPDGRKIELESNNFPMLRWFGERNALTPAADGFNKSYEGLPPIICSALLPLDAAIEISNLEHSRGRRVVASFEATDFAADGTLKANTQQQNVQQAFFQCSDFAKFAKEAACQLTKHARCTMKHHLEAPQDPYIFIASKVTVFRGDANKGFPFLDRPVNLDVIATAMWTQRPDVKKGYYRSEVDQTALLQRLNLIGLTAADHERDEAEDMKAWLKWNPDEGDLPQLAESQPILVISLPGCLHGALHPRTAVANSLRHFRLSHGRFFSAIVVACGEDRDLAKEMDRIANADVYEDFAAGKRVAQWHWNAGLMGLGVNDELHRIAWQGRKIWNTTYNERQLSKRISLDNHMDVASHRRRSSGLSMLGAALRENTTAVREAMMITTGTANEPDEVRGRGVGGGDNLLGGGEPMVICTDRRRSAQRTTLLEVPPEQYLEMRRQRRASLESVSSKDKVDVRRSSKDLAPDLVDVHDQQGTRSSMVTRNNPNPSSPSGPSKSPVLLNNRHSTMEEMAAHDRQSMKVDSGKLTASPGSKDPKPQSRWYAVIEEITAPRLKISELAEQKKAISSFGGNARKMQRPDEELFDRVSTLANAVSEGVNIKQVQNVARMREARAKARMENESSSFTKRQQIIQRKMHKQSDRDHGSSPARFREAGTSPGSHRLAAAMRRK